MLEHTPQRIAVIDLGSNTARLVVFNAVPGYAYKLEDEIREVVRLRQGMTEEGLNPSAIARAFLTLRLFKQFCDTQSVDRIITAATSAVREAANGRRFVARVEKELGLRLQVLSGPREAYYGTLGVLNEVAMTDGYVLDIGGGSAQISQVMDRSYVQGDSVPLGALALAERFVGNDPITDAEYRSIQEEIERHLDRLDWLGSAHGELVGLGGTIRNMAKIEHQRLGYPLTLHGFDLTRTSIEQSIEQFRELPLEQRKDIPGLSSDRADIILPGAMTLLAIMDRLSAHHITISANGLREGLFFEQFWRHLEEPVAPDMRRFSVLNIARNYQYNKRHANHVRYLAGRLFDQLAPLHGYGPAEREILDAASLLHDLGTIIDYDDHHKHSLTLVIYNGLPGHTPRETALIALLTRYHRRGEPEVREFGQLLNICGHANGERTGGGDDADLLVRLAAILRLAEYMERGRNAAVDDVAVRWGDDYLRVTLIADKYPAVELWQTERNALELMQQAFGRRVILDSTAAPQDQLTLNDPVDLATS